MNKILDRMINIVDKLSEKSQANKQSPPSEEFIEAEQVNKELNEISTRIKNTWR